MPDVTRGERLLFMATKEEVEALDNWRFEKRMPSRASAVRELLKRGLTSEGFAVAGQGTKSGDFGMLDGEAEALAQACVRAAKRRRLDPHERGRTRRLFRATRRNLALRLQLGTHGC